MSSIPPNSDFDPTTSKEMVRITSAVHPMKVTREFSVVEPGTSITTIVERTCPPTFIDSVFVTVDGVLIDRSAWSNTFVEAKNIVVVRAIPQGGNGDNSGKQILRIVAMIALIVVAFAIAGPGGGAAALEATFGVTAATATAIIVTTVTMIGSLLLNALIPPSSLAGRNGSTAQYGINGVQNQEVPYGTVPRIYGRTLITPPKGAHSYTVATNNNQYLYALFDLGPGPIAISDIKIGQTPIDDFADVTYEVREGRSSDAPLTFFTNAVHQTPLSIGFTTNGATAVQRTAINTTHIEVDISCPGLYQTDSKGNVTQEELDIYMVVNRVSDGFTVYQNTFQIKASSTSSVVQTLAAPEVASNQYDVHLTRTTPTLSSQRGASDGYWTALRTWGPSTGPLLPINRAKIAIQIKATEQLNGDIASLNCIAQRYAQVWNGTTFTESLNTHPAWAAYDVLTGSSNARALDSNRIDLDSLLEWATTYPSAEFNYVFSSRSTIWQALRTIGAAGRAIPVIRDGLYGFVFDRTQDTPVQMFTARNISNFKATKSFIDETQGVEIRYVSETMGWQQHSVYVYASGVTSDNVDFNKVSPIELVGVTSDDWAYKLGSYFFAAGIERSVVYTFDTDLDHLACNPGDRILIQHDVLNSGITSGRINSITRDGSNLIVSLTSDEVIIGDGTSSYSITIRTAEGGIYTFPVTVATGETNEYTLAVPHNDSLDSISVGDLIAVWTSSTALVDAVVKTITPQADFKATVTCLDYAPQIHSGDGVIPPVVTNTRINKFVHSLPVSSLRIIFLTADEDSAMPNSDGTLTPRIHGTFQPNNDGIPANLFEVQFQVDGDVGWTAVSILPSGAREFFIPIGYNSVGITYNVRVRGTHAAQTDPGPWATASILIAEFSIAPPTPLSLTVVPVVTGVEATIVPGDLSPVKYRLYINSANDFATASLAAETTTPVIKIGGLRTTIYYFWATTVNGAGVESGHTSVQSALPLPVGYNDLKAEVTDFLDFLGNAARGHTDAIDSISTALTGLGLGNRVDFVATATNYTNADSTLYNNVTTGYTNAITTVTGPSSTIVTNISTLTSALTGYLGASAVSTIVSSLQTQINTNGSNISTSATAITAIQSALTGYTGASAVSTAVSSLQTQINTNGSNISTNASAITALQSALTGYTGASAVATAVSGLQTQITADGSNIAANASAITAVSTQVGNFYATGLFRVNTRTTPAGADARISLEVAASSGGSSYGAAIYLDAMTTGVSRATVIADQFFVTDGSNTHAPFYFSGGVAYMDSAMIQNLTANVITSGTLNVGVINAGSITTSHLHANAVTTTNVGTGSTTTMQQWTTFGTIASVTITTDGGPILVTFTDYFSRSGGHSPVCHYRIELAGVGVAIEIQSGGSGVSLFQAVCGTYLDVGAPVGNPGTYTYNLTCSSDGDPSCISVAPSIVAMELKR